MKYSVTRVIARKNLLLDQIILQSVAKSNAVNFNLAHDYIAPDYGGRRFQINVFFYNRDKILAREISQLKMKTKTKSWLKAHGRSLPVNYSGRHDH